MSTAAPAFTSPGGASPLGEACSVDAVAEMLERLATVANDPATRAAFERAQRALRWQPAGRPARFEARDRRDLVEVNALLVAGKAATFNEAALLVAGKYSGDARQVRSIAERLRRRHASKKNRSTEI
jgi:hypothetical protein